MREKEDKLVGGSGQGSQKDHDQYEMKHQLDSTREAYHDSFLFST